VQRQRDVEAGKFNNFHMFPEGSTTNGSRLLSFKKGAFIGEMPVIPQLHEFDDKEGISMSYDVIHLVPLLIGIGTKWRRDVNVKVMPPFIPNDYLFETHKDKGEERWEIYAWAMRDAMCKEGNIPKSDMRVRDRIEYMKNLGSW